MKFNRIVFKPAEVSFYFLKSLYSYRFHADHFSTKFRTVDTSRIKDNNRIGISKVYAVITDRDAVAAGKIVILVVQLRRSFTTGVGVV